MNHQLLLQEKAYQTLSVTVKKGGKSELYTYLNECISTTPVRKVLVHKICCRNFSDPQRLIKTEDAEQLCVKKLRSTLSSVNIKEDCFFCGVFAVKDERHPERSQVHVVSALPIC